MTFHFFGKIAFFVPKNGLVFVHIYIIYMLTNFCKYDIIEQNMPTGENVKRKKREKIKVDYTDCRHSDGSLHNFVYRADICILHK